MLKILRELLTGADNSTQDVGRWLWLAGFVAYIAFQGCALVFKGQPWDPQAFAIGLGAVLALGGVGVAVKAGSEPPAKAAPTPSTSYGESLDEARK